MDMKILNTVGKRINFILDLKDITRTELAKSVGVAKNTVSNYVNDNRTPDLAMLSKIADFLNVSTDFLLMRTDDYSAVISKEVDGKSIVIKLKDKKCHLTQDEIQILFDNLNENGWDMSKILKNNIKK